MEKLFKVIYVLDVERVELVAYKIKGLDRTC